MKYKYLLLLLLLQSCTTEKNPKIKKMPKSYKVVSETYEDWDKRTKGDTIRQQLEKKGINFKEAYISKDSPINSRKIEAKVKVTKIEQLGSNYQMK